MRRRGRGEEREEEREGRREGGEGGEGEREEKGRNEGKLKGGGNNGSGNLVREMDIMTPLTLEFLKLTQHLPLHEWLQGRPHSRA